MAISRANRGVSASDKHVVAPTGAAAQVKSLSVRCFPCRRAATEKQRDAIRSSAISDKLQPDPNRDLSRVKLGAAATAAEQHSATESRQWRVSLLRSCVPKFGMRDPFDHQQDISTIIGKVRSEGFPSGADFLTAIRHPLVVEISPWELWSLIGFVRHERRQKWVGLVVESKLKANGRELGAMGAFAHPEQTDGPLPVPDMPDWRYYFHGRGCCFTHEDGTTLDVDFADDGSAAEIDPYFYSTYLSSARKLEWSDAQLRNKAPLETTWHFDLERLRKLEYVAKDWRFRLTNDGRRIAEYLEPIVDEINRLAEDDSLGGKTKLSWLLVLLGDARSAANFARSASKDVAQALAAAAAVQIEQRVAFLKVAAGDSDDSERRVALTALAALGRSHAEPEVIRVLEMKPAQSSHLLCLRIIESWNDHALEPKLVEAVHRLGDQGSLLSPLLSRPLAESDEIVRPRNGFLVSASRLILSYHTPATIPPATEEIVRRVLAADRAACDAEAGFLLYLLSPAPGFSKIKAALNNKLPITREEAAVFFGMIGTTDAIEALIECASGNPKHGGHEAACVLSMLNDERARVAAENWKRRNDGYEEAEAREIDFNGRKVKTWKMDDVMRAEMRSFVQGCWDRLPQEYGHLLSKWSLTH